MGNEVKLVEVSEQSIGLFFSYLYQDLFTLSRYNLSSFLVIPNHIIKEWTQSISIFITTNGSKKGKLISRRKQVKTEVAKRFKTEGFGFGSLT